MTLTTTDRARRLWKENKNILVMTFRILFVRVKHLVGIMCMGDRLGDGIISKISYGSGRQQSITIVFWITHIFGYIVLYNYGER